MNKEARKSVNEELKKKFVTKFHEALSKFTVENIKEAIIINL